MIDTRREIGAHEIVVAAGEVIEETMIKGLATVMKSLQEGCSVASEEKG